MTQLSLSTDCLARSQNCEKRLLASSCPPVRMEQLGSQWTDFHEIWYLSTFRKPVNKIQVSLNSDKNNRYFTWRRFHIYEISHLILLKMRNISHKSLQKIEIYILCSITFPRKRAVYEIMSENVVQLEKPHVSIIRRMRFPCWVSKVTRVHAPTHTEIRNTAFSRQQWFLERASVLRYMYIVCLVFM